VRQHARHARAGAEPVAGAIATRRTQSVSRNASLAVAGLAVIVLVLYLGLVAGRTEHPAAAVPSPNATATAQSNPAATSPASTSVPSVTSLPPCQNVYQQGDVPIVAPRKSGQHLEVALDAVRPGQSGHNRWQIRLFVPASAPANAVVALEASVTGPSGALQVFGYEVGPPNAETIPAREPATVTPCGSFAGSRSLGVVIVGVETSSVASGSYTLTWRGIRRPEGDTATETWTVTLNCTVAPGPPGAPPATECK